MVVAVALIAILTASITSTFVEAAQRRHRAGVEAQERDSAEALRRQLDEVLARLAAIDAALKSSGPLGASATLPAWGQFMSSDRQEREVRWRRTWNDPDHRRPRPATVAPRRCARACSPSARTRRSPAG